MEIQDLKEKIFFLTSIFGNVSLYNACALLFADFEASNKTEQESHIVKLKQRTPEEMLIYYQTMHINVKSEIEGMKKEIFEQYAYTKKYIACIEECRAEIKELKNECIIICKDKNGYMDTKTAELVCKLLNADEERKMLPITVEVLDYLIEEANKYFIQENVSYLSIENLKAMRNKILESDDDGK